MRSSHISKWMAETVVYGGLLVSRSDMYHHLKDCGVVPTAKEQQAGRTSPAALAYMGHPAVDAAAEWRYEDGAWTDGERVLP